MNSRDPDLTVMPDVQSAADTRRVPIQHVGVKGLRYPLMLATPLGAQPTVGVWNMTVHLPAHQKGTHMSRFIGLLEACRAPLDFNKFGELMRAMVTVLDAESGRIELSFPYFITKTAPASGVKSSMDYEVGMVGELRRGALELTLKLVVPVTSLCPCSKEISDYGAHNQRSHVSLAAVMAEELPIDELIAAIERQASCELYGLLKRSDEKFVTERAYENPKFVEDLVRDLAGLLNADQRVLAYKLEVENFESIHNHSAYALIERDKRLIRG